MSDSRTRTETRFSADDGSAPAAAFSWVAVAGIILAALLLLGAANTLHGRVHATADLAALAASDALAVGGNACVAAQEVVSGNGAYLVDCRVDGLFVEVTAGYRLREGPLANRSIQATARAGPAPGASLFPEGA